MLRSSGRKLMIIMCLLFAVPFTLIPSIIGTVFLVPEINNYNIAKNGKLGVAEPYAMEYSMDINEQPMYKILFLYSEDGDKQKEGITSAAYTKREAEQILASRSLVIRYNSKGAVQENYKFSSYALPISIMIGVFLLVGIGFWIAVVALARRAVLEKKLFDFGIRTQGVFINMKNTLTVNDCPYYKIMYSYIDERGERQVASSPSKFTLDEANRLKQLHYFEIAHLNGQAMITQDPYSAPKDNWEVNLDPYNGAEVFSRYAERDPLFEVLRREIAKEPSTAARKKLLAEHADTLKLDTMQNLEQYIEFLSVNEGEGRRAR